MADTIKETDRPLGSQHTTIGIKKYIIPKEEVIEEVLKEDEISEKPVLEEEGEQARADTTSEEQDKSKNEKD